MEELIAYLDSDPDAAERLMSRLGVHVTTLYRWTRGQTPHRRIQKQIERITKGAVPASAWTREPKS